MLAGRKEEAGGSTSRLWGIIAVLMIIGGTLLATIQGGSCTTTITFLLSNPRALDSPEFISFFSKNIFYGDPKSCFNHIDSVGIGAISYPIRMVIIMGDDIATVELESN